MRPTATALPAADLILDVPLELIDESPSNTRRTWGNLEELGESLKVRQLQAGLARPKGKRYELVFGHRRKRALALIKAATMRLEIREMTDPEALEAQAVENLQRTDLHPLEEAEGFEQLHKIGWSADDMAAKIGKSRGYVFASMKLLELTPELRKAFYAERFPKSVALYLARIPSPLQPKALKDITDCRGQTHSARESLQIIQERFMLRLVDAPFDRGDAALVPKAGACKDCPKRTGNQGELFADVKSGDVCTDPVCYGQKVRAAGALALEEAAAKGTLVLEGKAAKAALANAQHYSTGKYVRADAEHWSGSGTRTFGSMAKGVEAVLAVGEDGQPVKLLPRKAALEAIAKVTKTKGPAASSMSDDEKKRRKAAARKKTGTMAVLGAIVDKAKAAPGKGFWEMLSKALIRDAGHTELVEVLKRRGANEGGKAGSGSRGRALEMWRHVADDGDGALRGLVVELSIARSVLRFGAYQHGALEAELVGVAKHYKLNAKAIAAKAVNERIRAKKAQKAARKAAAK